MSAIEPIAKMDINPRQAARALRISYGQFMSVCEDGSKASSLALDWLICHGFTPMRVHGGTNLLLRDGVLYKLRAMTDSVAFTPSVCRGAGRKFSGESLLADFARFSHFLVFDVRRMPTASFYPISTHDVFAWMKTSEPFNQGIFSRLEMLQIING